MKLYDSLIRQRKMFEERTKLRVSKGKDYANTKDCLLNFKRVAKVCDIFKIDITKPYGVTLYWMVVKLDRICNLINSGVEPNHESLRDNMKDLQNYGDLTMDNLEDYKSE